jgi:cbb3-type cytochrome oxidase subunit 3
MAASFKIKKLRTIYILYWLLLTYIIVFLSYWFILLNKLNKKMADFKSQDIQNNYSSTLKLDKIETERKRKQIQYISEGSTFFLLIVIGAVFVFRAERRQILQSQN